MPRSVVVGLLAAVSTAMSVLAGLIHTDLVWSIIGVAATPAGLAAYLAFPSKKNLRKRTIRFVQVFWDVYRTP
jgi:hypothetical protein